MVPAIRNFKNNFKASLSSSAFFRVFNFRDDKAAGRSCLIISTVLLTVTNTLTTGIFYTGFLTENDIDIVKISFINVIPLITSLFSFLSPVILGRFKKRKHILALSRIIYYTLNILGITVIPLLGLNARMKYILFILLVFLSSAVKFTFESGFQVWQADFLPDNVKANFFSVQQIVSGVLSAVTITTSAFITDSVKHSGNQLKVMMILRFCAFIFALAEVFVITYPKEFPHKKADTNSFHSIVTLPFKHHKFIIVMLFVFLWNFASASANNAYDVYILNTVHVSYSMISVINALYSVFLITFAPMWKRFLRKHGWLKTFAVAALMHAPSIFLNGFVNEGNYVWLYTSMRLLQHFEGVGLNLTFANMAFLYLPQKNQTHCMSFFLLISNLASFTGQLLCTAFLAATPNLAVNIGGYTYTNVLCLTTFEAMMFVIIAVLILKLEPKLKSDRISN